MLHACASSCTALIPASSARPGRPAAGRGTRGLWNLGERKNPDPGRLCVESFVLHLPDRSRRRPACADAVRAQRRRFRARHAPADEAVIVSMRYPLAWPSCCSLARCAAAWAALSPVQCTSHDVIFEIPKGTWARRMAGNKVEILPSTIRLTLGIRDVLVLKNMDDVPQAFGPVLMMPGQSFRLPFAVASVYQFCLHRARQRADDHHCRAEAGIRLGQGVVAVALSLSESRCRNCSRYFPRWR
jgi:hypothetical protein